jgi:FAD/FMN-containing dehydrogenase
MNRYESWGRFPKAAHTVVRLPGREAALPADSGISMLPFGNGRSYGDSCLNDGGMLVDARALDRFIAFDPRTGTLRCESGVLLAEILDLVVPQGWFVAVTPGTRFVTVGGAVANDVHGKNHHRAGTFGRHVKGFELLRSDGTRLRCGPAENPEWFRATIGGLGLTGLITWVELALKRIAGPAIDEETLRFDRLDEFFRLSRESDATHEYTVAWIDCTARGDVLGRGHFMRGNDAAERSGGLASSPSPRWGIPFDLPFPLVNAAGLRAFNAVYLRRQGRATRRRRVHYSTFFYPLDAIGGWNRIYGPNGLLQYQCVIPPRNAGPAISAILDTIAKAGTGSFLAVLKVFGDLPSPGLLSFPRPGATLALDFPNLGRSTLDLLDRLDAITMEAQGAVYPAKDARMSVDTFRRSFPHWHELEPFIDPRFSSSFWRRVTAAPPRRGKDARPIG